MLRSILRDDAIRILLPRAAIMWLLVRLVFIAVTRVPPGVGDGSATPPPAGVILVAAFLSVAEWRRRGESAFWRNFGVSILQMIGIALTAAAACELLLYLVTEHAFPDG
jgi:hypothetical protein